VGFGRRRAHVDLPGDLLVGQPQGDQDHHLAFPRGQLIQAGPEPARPGAGGELGDQAPGHRGRQQRRPAGDHPDRPDQLGGVGVLDQKPGGAGPQPLEYVLVQLEGGQDDDVDAGQLRPRGDPPGRLDAVEYRHADVHQQHVRRVPFGDAHGLLPVGGLAHHLEVVLGLEQRGEPGPDQFLVIGQCYPDHGATRIMARLRRSAATPGR
jgi:hypothetical protein